MLWALLTFLSATAQTPNPENPFAIITAPRTGDSLFGVVSITGTASHPELVRYTLEFDRQDVPGEEFAPITGQITQQVTNGVLGQWDSAALPDGRYQIRLRVLTRSGAIYTAVTQNLRIANREPTPLPTPIPTNTPLSPATAGPSPRPLIEQPPTTVPRPTVPPLQNAGGSNEPPASNGETGALWIISLALQDGLLRGLITGALVAIALAIGSAIYLKLRPTLRRWLMRLRYR